MPYLDNTGLSYFLTKLKTIFPQFVLDNNNKVPKDNLPTMTGATSTTAGTMGAVPAPGAGAQGKYLRGDGTWQTPAGGGGGGSGDVNTITMNNRIYSSVDGNINLGTVVTSNPVYSGATEQAAGVAGLVPGASAGHTDRLLRGDGAWVAPTNAVPLFTGATADASGVKGLVPAPASGYNARFLRGDGAWANLPNASATAAGVVTASTQTFAGNKTFTGVVAISNTTAASSTSTGALKVSGGISSEKYIYGAKVYNAVWNDYAECRKAETVEPGRCVTETESGVMKLTDARLQKGCRLTSDTYGTCMGETEEAKTPIAVAGRVLVYPFKDRSAYHIGDAVCSAPEGTVDVMSQREIRNHPDRIVGIVSEIPDYDIWQAGTEKDPQNIEVDGRIWVYVR